MQILNDSFDEYAYSLTIHCTCARQMWKTLCAHFEGTNDGESYLKKLVESEEEDSSTSGRINDDFNHDEHEQDTICLMGLDHQVVSSSKSKNGDFTSDELLDAFEDLHYEFKKLISKNNSLEKSKCISFSRSLCFK